MYSVAPAEIVDPLIYDGFVDELVELLEIKDNKIMVPITTYLVYKIICTLVLIIMLAVIHRFKRETTNFTIIQLHLCMRKEQMVELIIIVEGASRTTCLHGEERSHTASLHEESYCQFVHDH